PPFLRGETYWQAVSYPLNKGVAALCGGGILSLEHINSMAYLSPKKKMGDGQISYKPVDIFYQFHYIIKILLQVVGKSYLCKG
ncbi:MAG: hypothetical protein Q8O92_02650, partial [Candidatus Latescibacter sp.]|nr:hypothetical protein [Candidatus Latescibacter sp.]